MRYDVLKISILNAVVFALLVFFMDIAFNGGIIVIASLQKAAVTGAITFLAQLNEILKSFKDDMEDEDKPGKKLGMIIG